jgi:hypothetical protein
MPPPPSVCDVRLAVCVWPEGEQETAINGATIWYGEWLIVSGMCKATWLLELRLSSSCLHLLPRLPVISILSSTFASVTCFRRQFLHQM